MSTPIPLFAVEKDTVSVKEVKCVDHRCNPATYCVFRQVNVFAPLYLSYLSTPRADDCLMTVSVAHRLFREVLLTSGTGGLSQGRSCRIAAPKLTSPLDPPPTFAEICNFAHKKFGQPKNLANED
jgi:hypothetical protein